MLPIKYIIKRRFIGYTSPCKAKSTDLPERMEGTTVESSMEEDELFFHVVYNIVPELDCRNIFLVKKK